MIERLYPGVYVTEVAFNAKSVEGVSTSTASFGAAASASLSSNLPNAPAWTDAGQGDPGVLLLELPSWTAESLYRAGSVGDAVRRAYAPWGLVDGLAIDASNAGQAPTLSISPGEAIDPNGRSIDPECALLVHRDFEP